MNCKTLREDGPKFANRSKPRDFSSVLSYVIPFLLVLTAIRSVSMRERFEVNIFFFFSIFGSCSVRVSEEASGGSHRPPSRRRKRYSENPPRFLFYLGAIDSSLWFLRPDSLELRCRVFLVGVSWSRSVRAAVESVAPRSLRFGSGGSRSASVVCPDLVLDLRNGIRGMVWWYAWLDRARGSP